MAKKESTWLDGILGSQLRDTQGEMLSVEGADISDLESGKGRWNDNHGKGFFNSLGVITYAKKIFKLEDCEDDRQRYYWDKVKAPYIYGKGYLYDDDDHPNAKAAAAILRSIHKSDSPLKLKLSVEGGVIARGISDPNLLARTKIHSCAITFTPANNATLVEPLNLDKSDTSKEDAVLIKSVMHLAKTDVPSFRHITRRASAEKIVSNFDKVREISKQLGLKTQLPDYTTDEVIRDAVSEKIKNNVEKIYLLTKTISLRNQEIDTTGGPLYHIHKDGYRITDSPLSLRQINNTHGGIKKLESAGFRVIPHDTKKLDTVNKALTAGYGGASSPGARTGGAVIQSESLDDGRGGLPYIKCNHCGKEGVYMKHQVKCRDCGHHYPMVDLYRVMVRNK